MQYFRPSLSYYLPLRPLFCLFLSGRLRQVTGLTVILFPLQPLSRVLNVLI